MNFGTLVGNQLGGLLVYLFGITSHEFELLWLLVLLTSLCQLYPMLFLWMIPPGTAGSIKKPDASAYKAS